MEITRNMITVDDNAIASMLSEAVGPSTFKFPTNKIRLSDHEARYYLFRQIGATVKKLCIKSPVDILSNTYHYTPPP